MGMGGNAKPRPLYPREKELVPIVQEAGWALGLVWTGSTPRTVQPAASRYTNWATAAHPPILNLSNKWDELSDSRPGCSTLWQSLDRKLVGPQFRSVGKRRRHNSLAPARNRNVKYAFSTAEYLTTHWQALKYGTAFKWFPFAFQYRIP
jgi:hypothetical protein